jgi:hypothetical protein
MLPRLGLDAILTTVIRQPYGVAIRLVFDQDDDPCLEQSMYIHPLLLPMKESPGVAGADGHTESALDGK